MCRPAAGRGSGPARAMDVLVLHDGTIGVRHIAVALLMLGARAVAADVQIAVLARRVGRTRSAFARVIGWPAGVPLAADAAELASLVAGPGEVGRTTEVAGGLKAVAVHGRGPSARAGSPAAPRPTPLAAGGRDRSLGPGVRDGSLATLLPAACAAALHARLAICLRVAAQVAGRAAIV